MDELMEDYCWVIIGCLMGILCGVIVSQAIIIGSVAIGAIGIMLFILYFTIRFSMLWA